MTFLEELDEAIENTKYLKNPDISEYDEAILRAAACLYREILHAKENGENEDG